jgi:hypothetical protein
MFGSPPGAPGGGITGVAPPWRGGAAIVGSTPAGGQMTPFDCASRSLKFAEPSDAADPLDPPGADEQPALTPELPERAGGARFSPAAFAMNASTMAAAANKRRANKWGIGFHFPCRFALRTFLTCQLGVR